MSAALGRARAGAAGPGASPEDASLGGEVLSHLAAQIGSAERLLGIVLEQGAAIRSKDVHEVVRLAGMMHGELSLREAIDEQRGELLRRTGARLGIPAEAVTVSALGSIIDAPSASQAATRSAELRGLLDELQREHMINRALMKVELSFLDHLMSTLALDSGPVYDSRGASGGASGRASASGGLHVLDLEA